MATTVLIAEILIIGMQSLIWLACLVIAVFDLSWFDLQALKGWEPLATLLILAVAYSLGVLIDRTSDSLFWRIDKHIRKKEIPGNFPAVWQMRLLITSKDDGIANFLEYIRSRLRIARSTTFNITLTIIAGTILRFKILWSADPATTVDHVVISIWIVGVLLFIAAFFFMEALYEDLLPETIPSL
ncbi:MAG TPA: hypothetical protein VK880_13300 [Anaerolineales bacterium]|nr:hypothetical protein [Anaerolineales bacterium]